MKYKNKEISELSDDDLRKANTTFSFMLQNYVNKTNDPKYIEKMKNRALNINPKFSEIKEAISTEMSKRGLV